MRRSLSKTSRRGLVVLAMTVSIVVSIGASGGARADHLPYHDPGLPVATRVNDLLSRMTLDEKLGQMTQAERASVTNAQITQFRLGSLLSGGGSAPANIATSIGTSKAVRRQGAVSSCSTQVPMGYSRCHQARGAWTSLTTGPGDRCFSIPTHADST